VASEVLNWIKKELDVFQQKEIYKEVTQKRGTVFKIRKIK